jgi:thiamine biosynthesis protein ThiS
MTFTLNGKPTEAYAPPLSVEALLGHLGFAGQPVLVELNGIALHPREHPDSEVGEGAVVEIIRIAAGG